MEELWAAFPLDVKAFIISVMANKVDILWDKIKSLNVDEKYHSDIEISLKAALQKYSKNDQIRVRTQSRLGNVEALIPAIEGKDVELTEEQISFLKIFEIEFAKTGYYAYLNHKVTKEIKDITKKIKDATDVDNTKGVDLPEEFYENFTQKLFDYETIIGGRNESADLIYNDLKKRESFDIVSHSEDESIAFVLASIKKHNSLNDFNGIYICRNSDGIASLHKLPKRQTIIVPSYLLVDHKQSFQKLCNQIIGVDSYSSSIKNQQEKVDVPKYSDYEMTKAIQKEMQKTYEEASILSKKGQGVFLKLLREVKSHSSKPEWVGQINIKYTVPALLLGEWHDSDEWQKEYLKEIGITNYNEFCQELLKVSGEGDTFIYMTNGYWRVRDLVESFEFLYDKILPGQIDVFKNYAIEVLTDINPYSNLKGLEGFFAFRKGVRANINEQFKNGIFKVLIGIEHLTKQDSQTIQLKSIRDEIIEYIFKGDENDAHLENIFYYITKYIEAAPERTLNYIQEVLKYRQEIILAIFHKEKQAELLWALEGISTFPEYFYKVIDVLIEMHKIDPGGNLNRPINSLKILLNLNSATNINPRLKFEGIVTVLNSIPEKYDEFLKEILVFPKNRMINEKYKFKYGYKFRLEKQILRWPDYYKIFEELTPFIIEAELISENKTIFSLMYSLYKESRIWLLNSLIKEQHQLDFDTNFWKELFYYKEYKRTNKQTSKLEEDEESLIDQLVTICEKNKSNQRKLWIFNNGSYDIIARENGLDRYKNRHELEKIIQSERKKIVREIYESSLNEIYQFTVDNDDPYFVIQSLKDSVSSNEAIEIIIFFIKVKQMDALKYIGSLITHFSKTDGIKWVDNFYNIVETDLQNTEITLAVLLNCFPSNDMIQFIETYKISGYYEQLGNVFGVRDLDVKKAYINKFINVGRAADGLLIMRFDTELYDDEFCIAILERASKQLSQADVDIHVIGGIFRKLQKSDNNFERMANLELIYSSYLLIGYIDGEIPNLSKLFFSNPNELIELIKLRDNSEDYNTKILYSNIFDNISKFSLTDDEHENKTALESFIKEMKILSKATGCEEASDFIVGGVLSKVPRNNYIPKEYVCEFIDKYYSGKLEEGFIHRGDRFHSKSFGNEDYIKIKDEIDALLKFKSTIKKSYPNLFVTITNTIADLNLSVEGFDRKYEYDFESQWID
jgi:hypothetical protein